MVCLQICNDFLGSKVHKNLYENLDKLGVSQVIFYPKRDYQPRGKEKKLNLKIAYSRVIGSESFRVYHRIFFRLKIRSLYKNLKKQVDFSSIDLAHATTLFSDGAIAYKIYKEFHIPYVVAVRSTDMYVFFKYRPDLRALGHKILKNAEKILFVGSSLKKKFYNHHVIQRKENKYNTKSVVINNGIDSFWLSNVFSKKNDAPRKILFVGRFVERKKIPELIEAFSTLKNTYYDLELNLVGEGGGDEQKVATMADRTEGVNYYGPIFYKNELLLVYRDNHIFAMPSVKETFGLVYAEALSQGLPILYTKGDGFDGTVNENIGEAIAPVSMGTIAKGLDTIINNYETYNVGEIDFKQFNWKSISARYKKMYQGIVE